MRDSEDKFDDDFIEPSMLEQWRRDYSLNDFPRDEFQEILPLKDNEKDFAFYVEWLADYLYNSPLSSLKTERLAKKNLSQYNSPDHAILVLAFDANLYDYEISIYDDFVKYPDEINETTLLPEIIEQAKLENMQKDDCGLTEIPCANFSDIPWRIPLAWILKKVPDKKERIELLKTYFEEYDYMSYK